MSEFSFAKNWWTKSRGSALIVSSTIMSSDKGSEPWSLISRATDCRWIATGSMSMWSLESSGWNIWAKGWSHSESPTSELCWYRKSGSVVSCKIPSKLRECESSSDCMISSLHTSNGDSSVFSSSFNGTSAAGLAGYSRFSLTKAFQCALSLLMRLSESKMVMANSSPSSAYFKNFVVKFNTSWKRSIISVGARRVLCFMSAKFFWWRSTSCANTGASRLSKKNVKANGSFPVPYHASVSPS